MRLVRTLRGRLVVIAMVWCGLFLFATGFSLQTMMRNYWQEAEADGLRLQLYDLLSRLEIQPDGMPVVTADLHSALPAIVGRRRSRSAAAVDSTSRFIRERRSRSASHRASSLRWPTASRISLSVRRCSGRRRSRSST